MKTLIYVTLESSTIPEEVYLDGKRSDFTYNDIVQILRKKYGTDWMGFTYDTDNTVNAHDTLGKPKVPEDKSALSALTNNWVNTRFDRDDLMHAFMAGASYPNGIQHKDGAFNDWFKYYLKLKY